MSSKAEQIMQAIVTALTVPALSGVPASQVYRDLTRAIDKSVSVAIAVEEGDEPAPDLGYTARADRELEVRLSAIAKGQGATSLADAPLVAAHTRLMANTTLGGLANDILEGPTDRQREQLEKECAVITKTYRVLFSTAARSLES